MHAIQVRAVHTALVGISFFGEVDVDVFHDFGWVSHVGHPLSLRG